MFVTCGIFYESGLVIMIRSIRWQQWKVWWVGIAVLPLPKKAYVDNISVQLCYCIVVLVSVY
jgi:hypothetical protein